MRKPFYIFLFLGIFALSFFVSDFALAAKPDAPDLLSPAMGEEVSLTPFFDWSNARGATTYNLYIGDIVSGPHWLDLTESRYQIQPHEALEPGTQIWQVRACNNDGCTSSVRRSFTAVGVPAGLRVSVTANPSRAETGQQVYFVVSGEDSNMASLYINFGDNSFETHTCPGGPSCLQDWFHSYSMTGTYAITARAQDNEGREAEAQTTITISAEAPLSGGGIIELPNPLRATNIQELIGIISWFVWRIAIAIAPIMFLIAGFLFITSGGDPSRLKTAKNMFLYTVIGLAVVLLASGLYEVLKSILGVTT